MLREIYNMTDEELAKQIKQHSSSEAVQELHKRHSPLIASMAKKYSAEVHGSGVSVNDFMDDSMFLIYKASDNYDPEKKTKFTTHLANTTRFHCLNTLNSERKHLSLISDNALDIAATYVHDNYYEGKLLKENSEYLQSIIEDLPDDTLKQVIQKRYFDKDEKNQPFEKIASSLGISTQWAIVLHNQAIKYIKKSLTKQD